MFVKQYNLIRMILRCEIKKKEIKKIKIIVFKVMIGIDSVVYVGQ